jgi:hypothetical protein
MMKKDDLLRFDSIRGMKLLELCQFSLIGFVLGYINGTLLNNYVFVPFKKENYVNKGYPRLVGNLNPKLWFHLTIDICIIIITTYYLKKITNVIPFIFGFLEPKYKSALKSENLIGFTIGIGFIYLRVLDNFQSRVDLLIGKINS